MVILASLLVLIVGLMLWFFVNKYPKLSESGRIMFFCGLLVLLLRFSAETIHLFGK